MTTNDFLACVLLIGLILLTGYLLYYLRWFFGAIKKLMTKTPEMFNAGPPKGFPLAPPAREITAADLMPGDIIRTKSDVPDFRPVMLRVKCMHVHTKNGMPTQDVICETMDDARIITFTEPDTPVTLLVRPVSLNR